MRFPRPHFSLHNALLVMTIVALSVTLWRTGYEVMPLRMQARNLRRELGHFSVEDPTRIYAQQSSDPAQNVWKWRLHLPSTKSYQLYVCVGEQPDLLSERKQNWLSAAKQLPRCTGRQLTEGEFTLDLALEAYDENWFCRYGFLNKIQGTQQLKCSENWLADLPKFNQFSDVSIETLRTFAFDEPVILLHIRRGILESAEDGWTVKPPVGVADSLVVWIE